jgi:glycosyltransferase involved in cell wall biosynthesis
MNEVIAPKPVGIILSSLAPGGAERVMINFANHLVSSGVPVTLVVLKNNLTLAGLVDSRIKQQYYCCTSQFECFYRLKNILEVSDFRAVYTTMFHINVIVLAVKMMTSTPTPIIVREANTLSVELRNLGVVKRIIYSVLIPFFYRRAHSIIAVSAGVGEDLVKRLGINSKLIKVVLNPVTVPQTSPRIKRARPLKLIAVGRLEKQKDFETLLRAVHIVSTKCALELDILGEGSLKGKLIALAYELGIQDQVRFLGRVDNVYKHFANADIYVLSSIYEGCPNSLLEAIACGVNVVATDCPSGPMEILKNGKYGQLCKTKSPSDLALAILKSVENPISAETLVDYGRQFSPKRQFGFYIDLIN